MVNGLPVKSSYRVKPLDVVSVMVTRPPIDTDLVPEDIPLDIVYEDFRCSCCKQTGGYGGSILGMGIIQVRW